jgi:hypothetical protein
MRYDEEYARYGRGRERGRPGRGEYGTAYEAPYRGRFRGYGMGYAGGALRSRGSFQAGQLRSGLNPVDEFEFEWGDGYVGGRGYGGTNYDYEHGYVVGEKRRYPGEPIGASPYRRESSPATRGGFEWGEYRRESGEPYGPSRYGYGPYYERLQRRRRSDDEIREDVIEALFYDTWVDADAIEVSVEDGIVTLTGTLPSYDEVRYATDDAWDVDGVRGVRSRLEVRERPVPGGPSARREMGGRRGTEAGGAHRETRAGAGRGGEGEGGEGGDRTGMMEPSAGEPAGAEGRAASATAEPRRGGETAGARREGKGRRSSTKGRSKSSGDGATEGS